MKRYYLALLTLLILPGVAYASSILNVGLGGTGVGYPSGFSSGQLIYGSGIGNLASVGTSTLTFSGPFSGTGFGAMVGGSNTTLAWTGLATTSIPTAGNLLYSNGVAGLVPIATSSETCSSPLSCTAHAVLTGGGAISIANAVSDGSTKGAASFTAADFNDSSGNISIDYTNGTAASVSAKGFLTAADWGTFNNKVATSAQETAGQLAAWSTTSGTPPKLYSTATTSLGVTGPITFSGTIGAQVGGVGGNIGCTTCVTTSRNVNTTWPVQGGGALSGDLTITFGGLATSSTWTAGQLAYAVNGNTVTSVATSTLTASSPLTGSFTVVGSGGSVGCTTADTTHNGCITSTDWNTFNGKAGFAYLFPGNNGISTSTGLMLLASTTIGAGTAITGLTVAGTATTTNIDITSVTGTQCLHSIGGLVSGTGADCGSGSSFAYPFPLLSGIATSTGLDIFASSTIGNGTQKGGLTISGTATSTWETSTFASTTVLSVSNLTSGNCVQASTGGMLTTTGSACNAGTVTNVTATFPLTSSGGATPALTFVGIGTSSPLGTNQLVFSTGVNTVASVGTTTKTYSGPFNISAGAGYLVGGSNSTLTWTGLATSTAIANTQVLYGTSVSGVGGNNGFIFNSSLASVGIGSTTPWGQLSIASSTYTCSISICPLVAIATSTTLWGSLVTISATTTTLASAQNPLGTVLDSGVRIAIGAMNYVGSVWSSLDQLFVNGRINTGDWRYVECSGVSGPVSADANSACGPFGFQADTSGSLSVPANTTDGLISNCLSTSGASCNNPGSAVTGVGAGLFFPSVSSAAVFRMGTSTPVMEVVARNESPQNSTSTQMYIGFTNVNPLGTTFEVAPTAGCYFTASSSQANWFAVCSSTITAMTVVNTGFASTSNIAQTGGFYRFRVEADQVGARFYMGSSTAALAQVANITTNIPTTASLNAGVYIAASAAGLAKTLDINVIKLWFNQPALNYPQ